MSWLQGNSVVIKTPVPSRGILVNSTTNRQDERRKHKRFKIKDCAFAVLTSGSANRFGKIVNLSHGGLAYRYLNTKEQLLDFDKDQSECELNLFFGTDEFKLGKVPLRVVSNSKISGDISLSMSQSRLQFVSLTIEQTKQLEYFIWHNQKE